MTMRYTHIGIDDQADALKNLPAPHLQESALYGRCILGGAESLNVAKAPKTLASNRKRRKSNQ